MKVGPVFTPGLGGTATFLIALIMALKGYKIRGVMGLDMPSNWIALHPGFHPESAKAIIGRAQTKVNRLMECVLSGGRALVSVGNIVDLLLGLLLMPVSFMFMILGRFFLAKLFFANNRCNGCGICAQNCPVGAVVMRGDKKPRPYWRYNCESCMRCMGYCPEKAIEAGHSWAVILVYLTMIPVSVSIVRWMSDIFPTVTLFEQAWVGDLIQFVYIYPSLFLSYYIFSRLIRIPAVNALFTYTTFTHVYRRYHEPDTELKDFSVKRLADNN
jgi:ferredoxin